MFPNFRLVIAAMFVSIFVLICGFGVFAAFRVNHEPLARLPAATTALQVAAGNGLSFARMAAATQPFVDRRLPAGEAGVGPSAAATSVLGREPGDGVETETAATPADSLPPSEVKPETETAAIAIAPPVPAAAQTLESAATATAAPIADDHAPAVPAADNGAARADDPPNGTPAVAATEGASMPPPHTADDARVTTDSASAPVTAATAAPAPAPATPPATKADSSADTTGALPPPAPPVGTAVALPETPIEVQKMAVQETTSQETFARTATIEAPPPPDAAAQEPDLTPAAAADDAKVIPHRTRKAGAKTAAHKNSHRHVELRTRHWRRPAYGRSYAYSAPHFQTAQPEFQSDAGWSRPARSRRRASVGTYINPMGQ